MNTLCRNYPTEVMPEPDMMVLDGKTFTGMADRGWNTYTTGSMRLMAVDVPQAGRDSPADLVEKADRARKCLTLALVGDYFERDPKPNLSDVRGRLVLVAPLRFNRNGQSPFRVYVQIARNNFLHGHLVFTKDRVHFLHVNAYMSYLADFGWDLVKAREIIAALEPMDLAFV